MSGRDPFRAPVRFAAREGRLVYPEPPEDSPSPLFVQTHGRSLDLSGIRRFRPRKIAEVGMGTAVRSLRMITLACQFHAADQVHFTGIDRFEDRPADWGPGISPAGGPPHAQSQRCPNSTGAGWPLRGAGAGGQRPGQTGLAALGPRGRTPRTWPRPGSTCPASCTANRWSFWRPRRQTVRRSSA